MELAEKLLISNSRNLATELFSKIITRSKHHNAAREKIIDISLSNSEYEYPQHLLAESIKENPSNYDMVYKAGLVNLEYDAAMFCFIEKDRHVRAHLDAKFQIAKLYFRNGKVLQADDYLNQILRINPKYDNAISLRREI